MKGYKMFVDGISNTEGILATVAMIAGCVLCVLWFAKVVQIAGAGAYRKASKDQAEANRRQAEQDDALVATADYLRNVETQEHRAMIGRQINNKITPPRPAVK
jgi:hypothetical protein